MTRTKTLLPVVLSLAVASLAALVACTSTKKSPIEPTGRERAAIKGLVSGVFKALESQDAKTFGGFFADSVHSKSFGHPHSKEALTTQEDIVAAADQTFQHIHTIEVIPNDDLRIKMRGTTASITVTGTNIVVDRARVHLENQWRWDATLANMNGAWQITGDKLSFAKLEGLSPQALQAAQECCMANLQVGITMPELNLRMETQKPVLMYSSVDTIPPVGFTATVSLTPSALLSNGRKIGSLETAAVTFRETVAHIPVPWGIEGQVEWSAEQQQFIVAPARGLHRLARAVHDGATESGTSPDRP